MFPTAPDLSGRTSAQIVPFDTARDANRMAHSHFSFDPRSHYAETFWLPILGPSTLWLLRKFAERFDAEPNGFTLDLIDMSRALGIASKGGRNNSFNRAISRVVSFKMGVTVDEQTIAVRRRIPTLHPGQVRRLPTRLANLHDETIRAQADAWAEDQRRSENVALTLLQLGDSPDLVEQQLISWGIDFRIAHQSVNSAWAQKARIDAGSATSMLDA